MIESKAFTEFLSRKKITANQFYLCHLLYQRDLDNARKYLLTSYKTDKGVEKTLAWKPSEVGDLIDRGYLIKTGKGDELGDYEVTERFYGDYYISEEEAGEQLWEVYPKLLSIDGVFQSTRTCDKDEVLETYYKRIKGSRKKHDYVLLMTARFKDLVTSREMSGMGIEKWIKGENWDVIGEVIGRSYEGSTSI